MSLVLPFNPRYTTFCPSCGSVYTEWHPAEGWGRCHAAGCSASWRMQAPSGPPKMRVPDHVQLIDDALVAMRKGMNYGQTFAVYAKMGVPGVTPERFSAAWAAARDLST